MTEREAITSSFSQAQRHYSEIEQESCVASERDNIQHEIFGPRTGARVVIPVGAPLKALLDRTQKRGPTILTNKRGYPWTSDGFRTSWGKACKAAGITAGLTFHDLRGSAVTRLAIAGASMSAKAEAV